MGTPLLTYLITLCFFRRKQRPGNIPCVAVDRIAAADHTQHPQQNGVEKTYTATRLCKVELALNIHTE
jgi:hypothetical protein